MIIAARTFLLPGDMTPVDVLSAVTVPSGVCDVVVTPITGAVYVGESSALRGAAAGGQAVGSQVLLLGPLTFAATSGDHCWLAGNNQQTLVAVVITSRFDL